jgi:peptidoglycan/LPS O-acetylase OafA/YrhL
VRYRADIDGLRAVSISTVVLFHLGLLGLPGGYIGVDVFFVISGYLITGVILNDIEQNSFSFLKFYDRRIRRILPVLLLMLIVVTAFGWLFLFPGEYEGEATSALYAIASASNIYFLGNTGYFDTASNTMPLLHTWSLAVEEQFYIFWPLTLFLVAAAGRRRSILLALSIGIALASFAWNVHLVGIEPKRAFYQSDARAWELAIGAIIAIAPESVWPRSKRLANLSSLSGLALILYASFHLTEGSPFPGTNALFPVAGAAFIIIPWQSETWIARVLSLSPVVLLGKVSYSLYIWHWPIIVFSRHYNLDAAPNTFESAMLLALMLAVATASWRFVEQPIRRIKLPRLKVIGAGIVASAVCLISMLVVVDSSGFPKRLTERGREMDGLETMWAWQCPSYILIDGLNRDYCAFGAPWNSAKHKAILWGDSHAEHLAPLIQRVADRSGVAVLLYRECPSIIDGDKIFIDFIGLPHYSADCGASRSRAISMLKLHPEIEFVIITSSWGTLFWRLKSPGDESETNAHGATLLREGLNQFYGETFRPGRKMVVIGDVPQWDHDPLPCTLTSLGSVLRRHCGPDGERLPSSFVRSYIRDYYPLLRDLRTIGWTVYLPDDDMCKGDFCISSLDGEFLYRDPSHLRRNLPPRIQNDLIDLLHFNSIFSVDAKSVFGREGLQH